MVLDKDLAKAVARIPQRSEKQTDTQKLVEAFVDPGIIPQLENTNNQIIFGRRGTGKTHILRVLESELAKNKRTCVCYVDARTFGSSSQFADPNLSIVLRCTALFRDLLMEIYNSLLAFVVNEGGDFADAALEALSNFGEVATEPAEVKRLDSVTERNKTNSESTLNAGATIASSASLQLGGSAKDIAEAEIARTYKFEYSDKIIFPFVSGSLREILGYYEANLYLLIDEWSSLPLDVQPYLAEFIKRSFVPLPNVALKIAALEHRSDFGINTKNGSLGFEIGADISASLDIDDYYVFDRNPEGITDAFSDILVRHLASDLGAERLVELGISDGKRLASRLFTERKVFQELVRAAEGVARDLINIFSKAYFIAQRKHRDKVDREAVLEAARQWFEQDKERNLTDELRSVLRRITDEVIGTRKARSFLLPRELRSNPLIQQLFDLRVLHLVARGYADKDTPGVRYDIYALDYGTYVDLMNTSKKPDLGFDLANGDSSEYVVPFDDKRSIRRIILTQNILETPVTPERAPERT